MIIDLSKFIRAETPYWDELEAMLSVLEQQPAAHLNLERIRRFHYLYQRAAADLARMVTFSAEPTIRRYLERLVSRAYGEIHESRDSALRWSPRKWFFRTLPVSFRRHALEFRLATAAMLIGCLIGVFILALDPGAKGFLLPFDHLHQNPSERVAREENVRNDRLAGGKASFSSYLMTHNTRVAIFTLALGITWGIGTLIMLFYNGVILGVVFWDYITAGQTPFLLGWLLPHGAIEIPAILMAGQAGLVLAGALIGWGRPVGLRQRLRSVSGPLVTLMGGVALLLIWAGVIEAFFSQYHEPVIAYEAKIAFGLAELGLLALFLARSGRSPESVRPNAEVVPGSGNRLKHEPNGKATV